MPSNACPADNFAWGYLVHIGYNMWERIKAPDLPKRAHRRVAKSYLRCNQKLWDKIVRDLADAGANLLVIDLGEAVQYQSHPELAVRNAWSHDRLRKQLQRLRKLGIEPIPKLNFSTAHDAWLGPYGRMIATDTYYGVCKDLIDEVIHLFDQPRLFHLGMDEETAQHQRFDDMAVIRQYDLWWHDLHFLADQVQRHNVRPWVWSDYMWHHPDRFFRHMPKSILQSNWYYDKTFRKTIGPVKAYLDLEAHGYDQIPTGSNHSHRQNFSDTVRYCQPRIDPTRLHGFLQTVWRPTLPEFARAHTQAINALRDARLTNRPR